MKGNRHIQNIIQLNLALIFMGTSGFFARYIDLPVPILICSRSILASIFLYSFCKWKGLSLQVKRKDILNILGGGIFMGLHWLTYFQALKLSNVAIGMLSLFTFPVITLFLEPIFLKTKFQKIHLLLGIVVLVGIYFLLPEFNIQHSHTKAVAWGVLSAFCYSLRNIISKTKVASYNGSALMFFQLVIIGVLLSPFLIISDYPGFVPQWEATVLLALITTATGHTLFMYSLRNFSTTSISILSCTQPVYGVLIAFLFLNERPTLTTFIGGAIIMSTVIIESIRASKAMS